MDPSPRVEVRPRSAVMISLLVVVNIIWWMVMIAAIGLGATHLSLCPVQPNIPLYLIVLGAANIFSLALTYTKTAWDDGMICILCWFSTALLHLFTFGWFIAGTTWVYPVYPPEYTPGGARYCHRITYQFAFVVTTLVWVAASLVFICGCCFALLTTCTVIAGRRLIPSRYSFYGATSDTQESTAGDV